MWHYEVRRNRRIYFTGFAISLRNPPGMSATFFIFYVSIIYIMIPELPEAKHANYLAANHQIVGSMHDLDPIIEIRLANSVCMKYNQIAVKSERKGYRGLHAANM